MVGTIKQLSIRNLSDSLLETDLADLLTSSLYLKFTSALFEIEKWETEEINYHTSN